MCTLSFVPAEQGYVAAMNRDESIFRVAALPPACFPAGAGAAAYPREPSGGAWIAANDSEITLALLNWHDAKNTRKMRQQQSRGTLIPRLIAEVSLPGVRSGLSALPLAGMLPFRLVGISQVEQSVREWRWDGSLLRQEEHGWRSHHWFSSSQSDAEAELERGKAFRNSRRNAPGGTLPWLRQLHASHIPAPGAFSVCVHRAGAATVSYTEIVRKRTAVRVGYRAGFACGKLELDSCVALPIASQECRAIA